MVWISHAGVARCADWLLRHGEVPLSRAQDWPLAAPGWGEWEIKALV